MKIIGLLIFLVIIIYVIFQWNKNQGKDPYYSESCGFDCRRIALIKPCFLGSTTGADGQWYLSSFPGEYGSFELFALDVVDSLIVAFYYDRYIVVPENRDTTWYIFIPLHKQKLEYADEQSFYEKVKKLTGKQIKFTSAKDLYNQLGSDGYLHWYPENYKYSSSIKR